MEPEKPEPPKGEKIVTEIEGLTFMLDEPVTTALNVPLTSVGANEDDSLSFIVLGKDSVEAQASLLASYVDIQQKSMSIVCTRLHLYPTINHLKWETIKILFLAGLQVDGVVAEHKRDATQTDRDAARKRETEGDPEAEQRIDEAAI